MRLWPLAALWVGILALGCGRPVGPAMKPGDIVRAEIALAPAARDWRAGAKVTIGMLVRVEPPGGEARYLTDQDVEVERAVLECRVTFWDGERIVGEPNAVPFVHDC